MSEGGRVRRKRRSRIPVRQPTGLYVHSSPPTVLPVHPSIVRQWLRGGEVGRLQDIVLKKKVQELHDAARAGDVNQVDAIVKSESRINLELSRDNAGTGILHKAVMHGHVPLQDFLLESYPKTVEVLDREKRNPLHYAAGNEEVWNRLVAGGADTTTIDREGFSPAFYMNHPRRLRPPAPESRSKAPTTNQGLVVKPSTIRIWIHDKDLGRLQKVMWEGLGDKLKTETSSQPLVRRFLNAVPYIMGLIRDIHSAAVNNDLELLQSKSADPVPKDILLSKDANGLSPLHKAAGLGHMEVARAIIEKVPEAVNAKDHQDRTPLHYAAVLKDQNQMYQLLVDSEATDHLEDRKGNTPSHYRAKPSELEGPKLLNVVPDAPRTAHIFPPSWDWRLLTGESSGETPITSPQTEAPPRNAEAQPKDTEEPKPEPQAQEEVRPVEDKPPEIEPTPDGDEKVDEPEESKVEDAPAVSDDEGVGSEANPSVENTSTPLSDTVNEDEEISGARLGETMTLSSSLFRSQALRLEESGNGNDSGNEEGDSSDGRVIYEENGEVEPSNAIVQINSDEDTAIQPAGKTTDQSLDDAIPEQEALLNGDTKEAFSNGDTEEALPNGDTEEATQSETPHGASRADSGKSVSMFRSENPSTLNEQNQPSRPNTAIEPMAQPENTVNGEDVEEGDAADTGEQLDNENHVNTMHNREGARNDEGTDESQSTSQNKGSSQDLNSTYTKIPTVDALAVNESSVREVPVVENTAEEAGMEMSQLDDSGGSASQGGGDKNETDEKDDETETSTEQGQLLEPNDNQTNESTIENEITESDADQATESQTGPCSDGNEGSKPGTAAESNIGQEDLEDQNSGEVEQTESGSAEPRTAEREGQLPPSQSAEIDATEEEKADYENSTADAGGNAVNDGADEITNSAIGSKPGTAELNGEVEKTDDAPDLEETEAKDEGTPEADEIEKDQLDQPITLRSAGGSRAEVLAITPAPPEEGDAFGDDQKAVAEGIAEADRVVAEELVAAGDMESMAEMVLNGKGAALLNMSSNNADVQLFINNIPQYIAKIERVHTAAREGDLRGVQTALDRRKFAVARDNNTPLKPTPLHVAALFGRTSVKCKEQNPAAQCKLDSKTGFPSCLQRQERITSAANLRSLMLEKVLRYLAGRFPESMHAQDVGGRTALHYAATLPDNGHFYSLLITLGADKSVIDNEGQTAEHYLRNKGELTRDELLNEYQNRPVPIDTTGLNFNRFSDKALGLWQWNGQKEEYQQVPLRGAEIIKGGYPIFNPEEGQYLANSLGEPLIKGLTEVAHVRPKDPVVHLANFLLVYSRPEEGNNRKASGKRAVTASMDPPGGGLPSYGENVDTPEDIEDRPETEEATREADGEGDGEELEDREDDEENVDDDNASVTEDPLEPAEPAFKPTNRDEHGQTILHFAAARSHGRNAIYQLLQEMDVNFGLRDGLYRTARDISEQMEITDNVQGIDKFVVAIAARGENEKLTELLLEGYDHILDAEDGGSGIIDVANERENGETVELLQGITAFEERREKLIRAIRFGSMRQVRELFREAPNKLHLAIAKNQQGRCSLHVAVLAQHENIVEYIAKRFPRTLHTGDNLMRSALHYAMGVEKVEPLSRILIASGAQRVVKDLKGRQPSYYFMNKTDIQKLIDEEEALRV